MIDKKIKFLVISGSERKISVSDQVIRHMINYLQHNVALEIKIIRLREYKISRCGECGDCNYKATMCDLNDDIPTIINEMLLADAIIYITPVHGFGMAHLMQVFIERAGVGYLRFNRPLKNKIAGCVVIGRKYNLGNVHDQLINNFLLNRMVIPGAGFPALFYAGKEGKISYDLEGAVAIESMLQRVLEFATLVKEVNFIKNNSMANERVLLKQKEQQVIGNIK